MKRARNFEGVKLRRAVKKNRISEGLYSGTLLYLKFLLVWATVVMADFVLEFRLEYLWPFWLLVRSVYDSFRYQGFAFSAFFVCVALTSDLVCFLFIPVQWLFFLASTYVWVQYVWHADRGICLPTVCLWCLFLYIEASVRLREIRQMPFTLDLCRPFAAHCIGYPVVTLGFGVKSFVSYKFRLRRQREVARENLFYMQLLDEALPAPAGEECGRLLDGDLDDRFSRAHHLPPTCRSYRQNSGASGDSVLSQSVNGHMPNGTTVEGATGLRRRSGSYSGGSTSTASSWVSTIRTLLVTAATGLRGSQDQDLSDESSQCTETAEVVPQPSSTLKNSALKRPPKDKSRSQSSQGSKAAAHHKPSPTSMLRANGTKDTPTLSACSSRKASLTSVGHPPSVKSGPVTTTMTNGDIQPVVMPDMSNMVDREIALSLESDIEKLRADLRASRSVEQELRGQVQCFAQDERANRNEIAQLKANNAQLQTKVQNLVRARQQDKQTITTLEKKIVEEQKVRQTAEQRLNDERNKQKRAVDAKPASNCTAENCQSEACRNRARQFEHEVKAVRRELQLRDDRLRSVDDEARELRHFKETHQDNDVLMSAITQMQTKNSQLEASLKAETRFKLDLFRELGEAKRQRDLTEGTLAERNREVETLRGQLGQLLFAAQQCSSPVTSASSGFGSAHSDTASLHNSDSYRPGDAFGDIATTTVDYVLGQAAQANGSAAGM